MIFSATPLDGLYVLNPSGVLMTEAISPERCAVQSSRAITSHMILYRLTSYTTGPAERCGRCITSGSRTLKPSWSDVSRAPSSMSLSICGRDRQHIDSGRASISLRKTADHCTYRGGFAHGYMTLTDDATVDYQVSSFGASEAAAAVRYDDPAISIGWPFPAAIISPQDQRWPLLGRADQNEPFENLSSRDAE